MADEEERERGHETERDYSYGERLRERLEPPTSQSHKTLENFLSLLGIGVIDFCIFLFLPQYTTWAVVGTAALLALYHPWWQPKPAKEKVVKPTQPHDERKGNLVWLLVAIVGFSIFLVLLFALRGL